MARIRTIKPEFFTSEDIVSLSPMARILYIALWCEADREGRLVWKPLTFKLRYLPADDCNINALCDEIVERGLVRLYGEGYAVIPSFGAHQHINPRESASQLPDPCASVTRAARVGTRKPRASDVQGGREGKGKEGNEDSGEPRGDSPPAATIPLVDGTEAAFTQAQVDDWGRAYPAVDVAQQLRQMRAWCIANPTRRKTARGVEAFIVGWLTKEQNSGRTAKHGLAVSGPKRGSEEYAAIHRNAAWWRDAGFESVWDAINNRCWHDNAYQFRDGKRMEVSA